MTYGHLAWVKGISDDPPGPKTLLARGTGALACCPPIASAPSGFPWDLPPLSPTHGWEMASARVNSEGLPGKTLWERTRRSVARNRQTPRAKASLPRPRGIRWGRQNLSRAGARARGSGAVIAARVQPALSKASISGRAAIPVSVSTALGTPERLGLIGQGLYRRLGRFCASYNPGQWPTSTRLCLRNPLLRMRWTQPCAREPWRRSWVRST